MNKIIILVVLLMCPFRIFAQEREKKLDFIIVIDESIPSASIVDVSIKALSKNKIETEELTYYPGNLSMTTPFYNLLLSDKVDTIYLEFRYYEPRRSGAYTYQIRLEKDWLSDDFNILKIYNLNKEKYKNMFDVKDKTKKYVFELDSRFHPFQILRK